MLWASSHVKHCDVHPLCMVCEMFIEEGAAAHSIGKAEGRGRNDKGLEKSAFEVQCVVMVREPELGDKV